MKKTLFILTAVLFSTSLFFSCSSKPKNESGTEITAPEEFENFEDSTKEVSENEEENSDTETSGKSEDENTENNTEDNNDDFDEVEDVENNEKQDPYDELEEIQEPEVTELELPPIVEETSEPELIEEESELPETDTLVTPEEITVLPELPEETNEIKEPEESENEEVSSGTSDTEVQVMVPSDYEADEVEDVEDVENETAEEDSESSEAAPEIIPSRSVSMKNGESLDVEYPGKGWIYLGCTDGSKNLTSTGRRIGTKNTNFTLIAKVPGTVILHFYKEDLLADKYIDDYLEVTVSEIKSKSTFHVKAPSYAEIVPKKPEQKPEAAPEYKNESVSETKQMEKTEAVSVPEKTPAEKPEAKPEAKPGTKTEIKQETENKNEEPAAKETKTESRKVIRQEPKVETKEEERQPIPVLGDAEEYLKKARVALDEKKYSDCYNNLQVFLKIADKNKDEAFYLLGQVYESNSDLKNIKNAIESYQEVTKNYPLSKFYEAAEKRIVYLKRFYINIR